jgi:hypothetical protein
MSTRPAPILIPSYPPRSLIISFGRSPSDANAPADGFSEERPTITRKYCGAFAEATPGLVSLRLFLTGINPQFARHRGCEQTWSRSGGHLRNHA